MVNTDKIFRCIKMSGLCITLILLLVGYLVPGWRIRELPTATTPSKDTIQCKRIGLWIAEICIDSNNCGYEFIPAVQNDMLPEERLAQWVSHQILGTIAVCTSLAATLICSVQAIGKMQSLRTSIADLVGYTCVCISGLFAIIPIAVVLEENNDYEKMSTVQFKSPYSLLIFGLGGCLMWCVVCIYFIDIVRKPFRVETLALIEADPNIQIYTSETMNNNAEEQVGTSNVNTVTHRGRVKCNIKMVSVLLCLFAATFGMVFALATPSWLDASDKILNCPGLTSFGLFYNWCEACAEKPDCRGDTIVFSMDIKVQAAFALAFNVTAFVATFFNRKTVRPIFRSCAVLVFYTTQLWSAMLSVNIVGHVLVMPKDVTEHNIELSYSFFVYTVASVVGVTTSAATGVFLFRNCSIRNNVPSDENNESNTIGAADSHGMHMRFSEIAHATSQPEPDIERAVENMYTPLELKAPPLTPSAPPLEEFF